MRTLVRVEYDGDTIFYGRVLTIDRDMFRSRTIHCEGAFTFFMDSVFQGEKNGFTITLHEYLQKLIDFYPYDITADDALMMQAELNEQHLANPTKALQCYETLLLEHPSSLFVEQARKQYNKLKKNERS